MDTPTIPPAAAPTPPPAADPLADVKDSRGLPFDAAKFRMKDGRPQLDTLGRFVPIGAGRIGKTTTRQPDETGANFDDINAALAGGADAARAQSAAVEGGVPTAESIIGMIQTALILIGEEEGILSETEKLLLRAPLKRVLAKYEIGDNVLPCEVDLALALVGLIVARLKKPKTATYFAKAKAWLTEMIFRRKGANIARVVSEENPVPAHA